MNRLITTTAAVLAVLILGVRPSPAADQEGLDVQYARALLQIEQALVQRVQNINRQTPGVITQQQVQTSLREMQAIQEVAQQTQQTGRLQWFPIMLNFAEATELDAQSAWAVAARARQADPNSTSPIDLEILRLRAELARLNLLRGRQLVAAHADEQQNWALGALLMEVQRLRNVATGP